MLEPVLYYAAVTAYSGVLEDCPKDVFTTNYGANLKIVWLGPSLFKYKIVF